MLHRKLRVVLGIQRRKQKKMNEIIPNFSFILSYT